MGKATLTSGLLLGRSKVFEKLEALPAGTKPRTSHHQSPGGERHGKRLKDEMIFLKGRERAILNQTNNGTVSKVTLGKRLEKWGGAPMGFFKRIDTILN